MQAVHLIDYGSGNLCNVARAFEAVGADVVIGNTPEFIAKARRLVLPGVGAFNDCMTSLHQLNLVESIKDYINAGGLFLGICVGMQILADSSDEYGYCEGLGMIPGSVVKLTSHVPSQSVKIPHVCWEKLNGSDQSSLTKNLDANDFVYFAHSYHFLVKHKVNEAAISNYCGIKVCAMVEKENVFGTQFHPEKSGEVGLRILNNFVQLAG